MKTLKDGLIIFIFASLVCLPFYGFGESFGLTLHLVALVSISYGTYKTLEHEKHLERKKWKSKYNLPGESGAYEILTKGEIVIRHFDGRYFEHVHDVNAQWRELSK